MKATRSFADIGAGNTFNIVRCWCDDFPETNYNLYLIAPGTAVSDNGSKAPGRRQPKNIEREPT